MSSPTGDADRSPGVASPPAVNLATLAARLVRSQGHTPFLTYYDGFTGERTELSYATFDNWASKTANLLVDELDVGPGDRVVTVLGNHWTAPVVAFACWKVGCCVVPVAGEAADLQVLARSGAGTGFVREDLLSGLGSDAGGSGLEQVVAVGVGLGARLTGRQDLPVGVLAYAEEVLAFADDYDDPTISREHEALLALPAAGGPVAPVRLTQGNLLSAAEAMSGWGLGREDRLLCARPVHLTDGLVLGHLGAFNAGASVVLTRAFEPDRLWRRVTEERATLLLLSPEQLDGLPEGATPDSLDCVVVPAGAPVDALGRARARMPVAVGHGIVEATCASTLSPRDTDTATRAWLQTAPGRSVGAVTTRAAVAALGDAGAPLADGVTGRLAVRGPVVMAGYDQGADVDAPASTDWFATADQGFTALGPDGTTHAFITGQP